MSRIARTAIIAALVAAVGAPAALARESALEGQPAVRHKYELRASRIELTPMFEATIQAEYQHTLSAGIKAEYHISDYLSVGGMVFFGGAMNTGLYDEIYNSLPDNQNQYPTPSQDQAAAHVNTMPLHGGIGATFTPWFGKMAVFGKAFVAYDVYISGGFGFAQTKNKFSGEDNLVECGEFDPSVCDKDPRNDGPHNAGFNPGLQIGGGMHFYINKWIAVDLSVRSYFFADNPSGLDVTHDFKVSSDDRQFQGHLMVGVGVAFFLPPKVKISK
jgi:outer membrane beta-barrel protein